MLLTILLLPPNLVVAVQVSLVVAQGHMHGVPNETQTH